MGAALRFWVRTADLLVVAGRLETAEVRISACDAVVFDLDDTLYLERQYVRSGARAVAAWLAPQLGYDPVATASELLAAVNRDPVRDPFGRWLRRRGLDGSRWLPGMLECYRAHRPDIRLQPGVERLLNQLSHTHALGVVTDGRCEQQRLKIEALGLDRWPLAIVLSDEIGREFWKPSVKPYRLALTLMGVRPEQAVYVGDNPAKDFLGARRAGMLSLRWRRRGGLHAREEPTGADYAPDRETTCMRGLERSLREQEPRAGLRPGVGCGAA